MIARSGSSTHAADEDGAISIGSRICVACNRSSSHSSRTAYDVGDTSTDDKLPEGIVHVNGKEPEGAQWRSRTCCCADRLIQKTGVPAMRRLISGHKAR